MASRTFATSDQLEKALAYLSSDGNPDTLFTAKLSALMEDVLATANTKMLSDVQAVLAGKSDNKIEDLRKILA